MAFVPASSTEIEICARLSSSNSIRSEMPAVSWSTRGSSSRRLGMVSWMVSTSLGDTRDSSTVWGTAGGRAKPTWLRLGVRTDRKPECGECAGQVVRERRAEGHRLAPDRVAELQHGGVQRLAPELLH